VLLVVAVAVGVGLLAAACLAAETMYRTATHPGAAGWLAVPAGPLPIRTRLSADLATAAVPAQVGQ
jgi:hypothetical protein